MLAEIGNDRHTGGKNLIFPGSCSQCFVFKEVPIIIQRILRNGKGNARLRPGISLAVPAAPKNGS